MKKILISLALLAICGLPSCGSDDSDKKLPEEEVTDNGGFAKGADISWVTELEDKGQKFANAQGMERECTALMKELGLNAIRLRVWVNPAEGYCNKEDVLVKAQRAAKLGMDVMIDFHYSDSWADPGKQYIPEAWKTHSYSEMANDVKQHTSEVLTYLKNGGIKPKWVQVGNETSNGLLWDMGKADTNPAQYAGFIKAGYEGVKSVFPEALVIVHLDNGFDQELYRWNLGILKTHGVDYDLVGMSLYPFSAAEWHNDKVSDANDAVNKCIANIKDVYTTFGKKSIIVETGMKVDRPQEGKAMLSKILNAARHSTDGLCLGVFYWEPEAAKGYNGGYDMGAFNSNGTPTAIMEAFAE